MKMRYVQLFILSIVFSVVCFSQTLTWQDITSESGYNILRQGQGGILFSTNGRGLVYQSTDNGFSWSVILGFPSSSPIYDILVAGTHLDAVLLNSTAGGAPYQIYSYNGSPNDWTRIYAVSQFDIQNFTIDDAGTVFAINPFGGGFRGGTLARFNGSFFGTIGTAQGFLQGTNFNRLTAYMAIDHANNFYVGDPRGGLNISSDNGTTWRKMLSVYSITAVTITPSNQILVGASPENTVLNTNGGVFLSSDTGNTWLPLGLTNRNISSVSIDQSGNLAAIVEGNVYASHQGSEWQQVSPSRNTYTSLLALPQNTFIASSEANGMTRSTDGGVSWSGSVLRGKDIFSMVTSDDGEVVVGTLGSGTYRSLFGGISWSQSLSGSIGDYVYSLVKSSGGNIYAGTNDGVYKSIDNAISWAKISDSTFAGSAYAVTLTSDGTIFAGTQFGVARSADNGQTWQQSGIATSKVYYLAVSSSDELYAGTEKDGIFASTNGGATWTNRGVVRNDIQTVNVNSQGHLFAGVYGGTYRSTNDGASWSTSSFTNSYVYSLAFGAGSTVYAGTYNGIFRSTNNGDTWGAAGDSGLAQRFVLSMYANPLDGKLLAGTYRDGVYRSRQQVAATPPTISGVPPASTEIPTSTQLLQNYPNPFNPSTHFQFAIAKFGFVSLKVYDLLGREVATLLNERKSPGVYNVVWDASSYPSGIYFYRLRVEDGAVGEQFSDVKKLLLLK
jgi:hypothetical protein